MSKRHRIKRRSRYYWSRYFDKDLQLWVNLTRNSKGEVNVFIDWHMGYSAGNSSALARILSV